MGVLRMSTGLAATILLVATGCVDHEANAADFCRAVRTIVDSARDDEDLTQERARATADDVADVMRDAEDATRSVRSAARDLLDAYDELADLLGDEDASGEELADVRAELEEARADVRTACADL